MRLCFAFVPWCATRLLGNARLRPSPTLLPLVRPPTPSVALAPVPPLDCNILRCCAANMDAIAGAPVPPLVAPPFVPAAVPPPPTQRSMCAFMAALPFGKRPLQMGHTRRPGDESPGPAPTLDGEPVACLVGVEPRRCLASSPSNGARLALASPPCTPAALPAFAPLPPAS